MWKKVLFTLVSIILLASVLPLRQATGQTPPTTLSVQPKSSFGLNLGDTLTINITVSNITNLAAWQFMLYYQSAVLNGTDVTEGPFLASTGAQTLFSTVNFTDSYNATHGAVTAFALIVSPPNTGANGSGTLATVTFKAVGSGPSVLNFELTGTSKTKLVDSSPGAGNLIPFTPVNGMAYVGMVDVAIGGIDTPPNIPAGSMAIINVSAQNRGQPPETFDVTLSYNGNPIDGTKTVLNLPGGGSQTLSFAWDTTPIAIGEYMITATATMVIGDIDPTDNTLSIPVYVGTRDVAVTGIASKTSIPAELPGTDVRVAIQNNGQAAETFNVTITIGSFNETQTTVLGSGTSGTANFFWNTTTMSYGSYTLIAYTPLLPLETSTTNNNVTVQMAITIPGDLNGDFTVSLSDLVILAQAYSSKPAGAKWNPNADIDNNSAVGLTDLVLLAIHYGQHYP
jgi:hypothetical protein